MPATASSLRTYSGKSTRTTAKAGTYFTVCVVVPILPGMDLRRAAGVVGLVGAVTSAVWFTFESPATGIDDANIFLAYARNISAGGGFVFNAGGERVEGFTSF